MTKYANGKIYKLVSNKSSDVYIGSCFVTLCKRLSIHKKPSNECCSKKMFQVQDAIITIALIEAFPCQSKAELKARELHYMTIMECININRPFITDITIVGGDVKEWQKAYREANAPEIAEWQKAYYEANAPAILEQRKEYYEANAPAILEQKKAYREANAPAIKERNKAYNAANAPAIKEYREANRDKINAQRRKAYAAKKLKLTQSEDSSSSE